MDTRADQGGYGCAQGLRPMSEGIEWFNDLGPEDQSEVLLFLRHHCVQARAVAEDASESIRRAGLRPTPTPAVRLFTDASDCAAGCGAGAAYDPNQGNWGG
ncbi:DUF5958 family protein [Streptomyces goshikiensis]|uniref:DUF5958 family protein n=1 Tax=Streptomyces goshikiensis TaxID=1942 RepID=UPI0036CDE3CE